MRWRIIKLYCIVGSKICLWVKTNVEFNFETLIIFACADIRVMILGLFCVGLNVVNFIVISLSKQGRYLLHHLLSKFTISATASNICQ